MAKHFYVTIEDKIFKSIAEASRKLDMGKGPIQGRILSEDPKWVRWRFLDDDEITDEKEKDALIGYSYLFTHKATGRFYVGSTKNIQNRRATHLWALRNGRHNNPTMQSLWDENPGEDQWSLLVFVFGTRQEAYEDEQERILSADTTLMLNSVDDVLSPISSVMKREGAKEFSTQARIRALKEMTPEQLVERSRKISEGQGNRWGKEGSKAAWSGGGNPFAKRIVAAGKEYSSLSEAGREIGVGLKTVWNRLKNPNFADYRYVD